MPRKWWAYEDLKLGPLPCQVNSPPGRDVPERLALGTIYAQCGPSRFVLIRAVLPYFSMSDGTLTGRGIAPSGPNFDQTLRLV